MSYQACSSKGIKFENNVKAAIIAVWGAVSAKTTRDLGITGKFSDYDIQVIFNNLKDLVECKYENQFIENLCLEMHKLIPTMVEVLCGNAKMQCADGTYTKEKSGLSLTKSTLGIHGLGWESLIVVYDMKIMMKLIAMRNQNSILKELFIPHERFLGSDADTGGFCASVDKLIALQNIPGIILKPGWIQKTDYVGLPKLSLFRGNGWK